MLAILFRIFVSRFYAQNAGTFLVIVLLAFGFLSVREHEALILSILGSHFLLALVLLLWGLYTLKVSTFNRQVLTEPEHLFLQSFRLMPDLARGAMWLVVHTTQLLPVIAYAIWIVIRGVQHKAFDPVLAIGVALLVFVSASAWSTDYRLRHPGPETRQLPRLNVRLPYELFFPAYWLRHEPLSFVLTKAFSGLLLAGVCRLYPTDDYDQRLLLIGLLLAGLGHSQVSGQLSAFERQYLLLLPNLPIAWWQRLSRYAFTYGLIWLPELLILLRNCPDAVRLDYVVWLWLTGWGWLLLMHSLAYGRDILPERWLTGIVASFVGGLLLIMYRLPVGAWLALGWLGAIGNWYRSSTRRGLSTS